MLFGHVYLRTAVISTLAALFFFLNNFLIESYSKLGWILARKEGIHQKSIIRAFSPSNVACSRYPELLGPARPVRSFALGRSRAIVNGGAPCPRDHVQVERGGLLIPSRTLHIQDP